MKGKKQKVIEIMPGCKIFQGSNPQGLNEDVMFGCPPEIVKVLTVRGMTIPRMIVLPRRLYKLGVVQCALEFPLYYLLFYRQGLAKGHQLIVIGHGDHAR